MKDAIILLIPLAGMLLLTYLLLQHFFNKQLKENDKELINNKAKTYLPLKIQAYERAIETYAIEQQGRRRRGEYEDGVIRTPLKSVNPSQ